MKPVWIVPLALTSLFACTLEPAPPGSDETETSAASNGDGDGDGDGDGAPGDGDGDGSPGDGDGSAGDGDGSAGDGDGDGDGAPDCVPPIGIQPLPDVPVQPEMPKQPGSTWAYFELTDFQPASCNFGETYSLETFKGQVTLLILVRSTCEICQGTIIKLEQMRNELLDAGHDVYFVGINQMGYDSSQQELTDRALFPFLQDTATVRAWELLNEPMLGTDDIYIYDRNGLLHSYFNYADANPNIDLNTTDGWDTIYNAMLAALAAP